MKSGAVPSLARYLLPRLQDVVFIAMFMGVIGYGPRLLNVDGDLGRHLTIGRYILQTRSIPTRDIFSHTMAGEPLTPHEWLAEGIYAAAYEVGGLDGVVWLCALLIAVAVTLCFRHCIVHSQSVLPSLGWAILGAAAASLHWLARPHLFTLLLVVIWTGELEQLRRGESKRWWIFPLLMLFWANLHGAFIVGFVIWGAYLVGQIVDDSILVPRSPTPQLPHSPARPLVASLLLVGVTSFLASLLNPSGLHLWATSLSYVRNRYLIGHTAEYLPPDFHNPSTWPFLTMIALSLLALGFSRNGRPERLKSLLRTSSILLLAGWTAMGLYSVRNVPLYALVAAPILAEKTISLLLDWGYSPQSPTLISRLVRFDAGLTSIEATLKGRLWPIMAVLLVGLGFAGGVRLDFEGRGNQFDPAVFPVQAVDWLAAHPQPGQMFNYFPWGGYLLFREWPELRVFIDGQTDFYGEALTRKYEQVLTLAEGWQGVLRQYHVRWVIMPARSEFVQRLSSDGAWQTVYQDETATILSYEPPP